MVDKTKYVIAVLRSISNFIVLQNDHLFSYICEDIIAYYCFDRMRFFSPNARVEKNIFALDARALLMLNHDKPSRIFPCMLLTRNHMIFLVQFGIHKQLLIFSKHQRVIRLSYERYPFLANFFNRYKM